MGAVEKILGRKIGVKNSKMENWYGKLESVEFLGWKRGVKNSSQEMKQKWTNG